LVYKNYVLPPLEEETLPALTNLITSSAQDGNRPRLASELMSEKHLEKALLLFRTTMQNYTADKKDTVINLQAFFRSISRMNQDILSMFLISGILTLQN
jgi:hypothetical protein